MKGPVNDICPSIIWKTSPICISWYFVMITWQWWWLWASQGVKLIPFFYRRPPSYSIFHSLLFINVCITSFEILTCFLAVRFMWSFIISKGSWLVQGFILFLRISIVKVEKKSSFSIICSLPISLLYTCKDHILLLLLLQRTLREGLKELLNIYSARGRHWSGWISCWCWRKLCTVIIWLTALDAY